VTGCHKTKSRCFRCHEGGTEKEGDKRRSGEKKKKCKLTFQNKTVDWATAKLEGKKKKKKKQKLGRGARKTIMRSGCMKKWGGGGKFKPGLKREESGRTSERMTKRCRIKKKSRKKSSHIKRKDPTGRGKKKTRGESTSGKGTGRLLRRGASQQIRGRASSRSHRGEEMLDKPEGGCSDWGGKRAGRETSY